MVFNRLTSEEALWGERYGYDNAVVYSNTSDWILTFSDYEGTGWDENGTEIYLYDSTSWNTEDNVYDNSVELVLGGNGANGVYNETSVSTVIPVKNGTGTILTIRKNRNYVIFTVDYGSGKAYSNKIIPSNSFDCLCISNGDDYTNFWSISSPSFSTDLSNVTSLTTTTMSNLDTLKGLIQHKLDVAEISYDNDDTLNDLTYLLNSIDSSATVVSKPSYSNSVSDLVSNFEDYEDFLKGVLTNQGFSTSADGLCGLVRNIKWTPSLSLSSSTSSPTSGSSVTVTATVTVDGNPLVGYSVKFYNSGGTLLDTVVTDSSGEAEYTFTYSSSVTLYCVCDETSDYINVTSSNMKIAQYVYNPRLDGTEGITTLSGQTSPTITDNKLTGGSGYLSAGWGNISQWKLTVTAYLPNNYTDMFIAPSGLTKRDYNWLQINREDGKIYISTHVNGTYNRTVALTSLPSNNLYTIIIQKLSNRKFDVSINGSNKGTFEHSAIKNASTVVIGVDKWSTGSNHYITDIQVERI